MKPIAPKPFTTPKQSKYTSKKAIPKFFFGDKPTVKPKKKTAPTNPANSRKRPINDGRQNMPKIGDSRSTPVPMPKKEMPYTGPRRERNPNLKPSGPKKKTPSTATSKPRAKKPTLNDFLSKGKRPPIKPGFKLPSDADVTLKGYNDKKTLNKYKKK